jgi:hypothetical protein
MPPFFNPFFNGASKALVTPSPMNLTEVAGIDFLSTPPTSPTESARAIPVSGTEPNNHPRQEISPEVAVIRIACNCGGHGWNGTPHHCAKLFQLEVEVKGLSSKPVVEIPKVKDFDGDYKSKPGRLQSTMRFKTAGGAEKEILLNLGVGTRMSNTANVLSPRALEKLRVGLQYCRVGAERYVPFEWVENKDGTGGTAIIKFKVRARRVRQLNNGWEFKDDAGSGIRGKPHEASAFRFWACLQHSDFSLQHSKPVDDIIVAAIQSQSGTYNFTDVRVWSKGNCPAKNRRLQGAEAATEVSVSISPNLQGVSSPPLPFLPVAIPMPIQLEQQQQHHHHHQQQQQQQQQQQKQPNYDTVTKCCGTKRSVLITGEHWCNSDSKRLKCGSSISTISSIHGFGKKQACQMSPSECWSSNFLSGCDALLVDELCAELDGDHSDVSDAITSDDDDSMLDEIDSIISSLGEDYGEDCTSTTPANATAKANATWSLMGLDAEEHGCQSATSLIRV